MKAERFEDLNVWQLSRELVVEIYKIASNENFKKDYGLSSQIQRASVSVLSNIDKEVSSKVYEVGGEEKNINATEPFNFLTFQQGI
ncbi:four helix bundle protein [bacterium]|nr:four helix bundle protein [bacterium]